MARIRSIHPKIFTDEDYMALSFAARELLKGLWCEADDRGIFEWKPRTLKARIMPADNVDVEELLSDLSGHFLMQYDIAGKSYGAIRNFGKWQSPQKPKNVHPITRRVSEFASAKAFPSDIDPVAIQDEPKPTPVIVSQREDGVGGEEGTQGSNEPLVRARKPRAVVDDAFEDFWKAYPHRGEHSDPKKPAREKFAKAIRDGADPETIIRGAQGYAMAMRGKDAQIVAQAQTWLHQARWEQYAAPAEPVVAVVNVALYAEWVPRWRKGEKWPSFLGPLPGELGCRCPPHLLAEPEDDAA